MKIKGFGRLSCGLWHSEKLFLQIFKLKMHVVPFASLLCCNLDFCSKVGLKIVKLNTDLDEFDAFVTILLTKVFNQKVKQIAPLDLF